MRADARHGGLGMDSFLRESCKDGIKFKDKKIARQVNDELFKPNGYSITFIFRHFLFLIASHELL